MKRLSKLIKVIGWSLLVAVVISIVTGLVIRHNLTKSRYTYYLELELTSNYWGTKCKVVDEIDRFIKSNAPTSNLSSIVLLNECDDQGIDVRLPLAQGLNESHYGTKGLATKTNSVFNLGAFDGHGYDKILGIYKYSHPNESVRPYLKKLKKSYLGNVKTEWDLVKNFVNLSGNRYASYEKYEQELQITLDRISKETKLDSLLLAYDHLKRDLNR